MAFPRLFFIPALYCISRPLATTERGPRPSPIPDQTRLLFKDPSTPLLPALLYFVVTTLITNFLVQHALLNNGFPFQGNASGKLVALLRSDIWHLVSHAITRRLLLLLLPIAFLTRPPAPALSLDATLVLHSLRLGASDEWAAERPSSSVIIIKQRISSVW